jgi:hypothetical protein
MSTFKKFKSQCLGCGFFSVYSMCKKCYSNEELWISENELKKKYKLTKENFDESKLFTKMDIFGNNISYFLPQIYKYFETILPHIESEKSDYTKLSIKKTFEILERCGF